MPHAPEVYAAGLIQHHGAAEARKIAKAILAIKPVPVWSKACQAACCELSQHQNPQVQWANNGIWMAGVVGREMSPEQVKAAKALQKLFGKATVPASMAAEKAYNIALEEILEAAKPA